MKMKAMIHGVLMVGLLISNSAHAFECGIVNDQDADGNAIAKLVKIDGSNFTLREIYTEVREHGQLMYDINNAQFMGISDDGTLNEIGIKANFWTTKCRSGSIGLDCLSEVFQGSEWGMSSGVDSPGFIQVPAGRKVELQEIAGRMGCAGQDNGRGSSSAAAAAPVAPAAEAQTNDGPPPGSARTSGALQ